ncbi:MAG: DNA alkylation repair protein [Bacillota bacterium]|nr:DNA alkylation repair protein [Bacillota bacterium]MDP4171961.1 DNA alkylation repair protein [Bacillota bacterium]
MQEKVTLLTSLFEGNRNEVNAGPMKNYMKGHFNFLGIKTPLRNELQKHFFEESKLLKEPFQHDFVLRLWEKDEREYQYAALAYIAKSLKKLQKDDLELMEHLITTKSWWDTVDMLAAHPVGMIAKEFPEVIESSIESWASGDHLWLRRTAILFQLRYKDETDEKLLYAFIRQNADSKEFFIRKAIGWALREYSKTNPSSVKQFIQNNRLAALSVREGSKYID